MLLALSAYKLIIQKAFTAISYEFLWQALRFIWPKEHEKNSEHLLNLFMNTRSVYEPE